MKARRWGVGGALLGCWRRRADSLGQRVRERVEAGSRAGGLEFGHKREPIHKHVLSHVGDGKGGGAQTICLPHPSQRCSCPSCSSQPMTGAPPRSQASETQLHPRIFAHAGPEQGRRDAARGANRNREIVVPFPPPTTRSRLLRKNPLQGRPLSDAHQGAAPATPAVCRLPPAARHPPRPAPPRPAPPATCRRLPPAACRLSQEEEE